MVTTVLIHFAELHKHDPRGELPERCKTHINAYILCVGIILILFYGGRGHVYRKTIM